MTQQRSPFRKLRFVHNFITTLYGVCNRKFLDIFIVGFVILGVCNFHDSGFWRDPSCSKPPRRRLDADTTLFGRQQRCCNR